MPAGYWIQANESSADANGFSLRLRVPNSDMGMLQEILIEGGQQVADQRCDVSIDPNETGALAVQNTLRGQPGVMTSSGNGAAYFWCEDGYPYQVYGFEDWNIAFINSLVAMEQSTWQHSTQTFGSQTAGNGPWIIEVASDSPAARAGLRVGQQMVWLNGQPISTADDVRAVVASNVNRLVEAELWENGHLTKQTIPLGNDSLGVTLCQANTFCAMAPGYAPPPQTGFFICAMQACYSDGRAFMVIEPVPGFTADTGIVRVTSLVSSADGWLAAYVLERGSTATLVTYDRSNGTRTEQFPLTFAADGLGDLSGVQVLGLTPDKQRVIFEDKTQVWNARLDGSDRKAVTEPLPYGASTTHSFSLSSQSDRLLVRQSLGINSAVVYNVDNGSKTIYHLDPFLAPDAMLDTTHLRAVRFDRPYDPNASNGELISRTVVGYEIVDLSALPHQTPS